MKKSTISKIILALVLIALIFSFAACGKKNDTSSNSGTSKVTQLDTPKLTIKGGEVTWGTVKGAGTYEYIITHADGTTTEDSTKNKKVIIEEGDAIVVRAVPSDTKSFSTSEYSEVGHYQASIQSQLISLVSGISGIADTISAVGENDSLNASVSIGGFIKSDSAELDDSLALALKANASKNDPEAMIDFKLNDKEYVSIGYKDGVLYIREPINFINTNETTANAFAVNVAAFEPTIKNLMVPVMTALGKAKVDMSTVTSAVSGILNGFDMDLSSLIDLVDNGDTVSLGVKIGLLSTGLNMLKTMQLPVDIPSMADQYIGYANKVLTTIGKEEIKVNNKVLSWSVIEEVVTSANNAVEAAKTAANRLTGAAKDAALAAIKESLVKIVVSYDSKKVINNLNLVIDLSVLGISALDYEAGLTIGIPTFAKNGNVAIDTSAFSAQDIVIDLGAALAQKGLDATVQGVVRLSDGLANKTNKWATVSVKANDEYTATGYINATGAYVDFSGIYELLDVQGQPAAFNYIFLDEGNLIDKLESYVEGKVPGWVEGINAAFAEKEAANAAPRSWDEYQFDLDAIIAGFQAASDKIDFVCGYVYNNFITIIDETVNEKANAGQADLIKWAFEYEIGETGTAAKDYALFYRNATSFEGLWNNIKACHEQGKAALDAATVSGTKTAGIQLKKEGEDNDLLDYIAKFVVIPTVDGEDVDWETTVAPSDTAALIAWLNWAFPVENEYRSLVDKILGIGLDSIIENGLYVEAIGGTGLAGAVRAAASSEEGADEYVMLSAGIDIKAGAANVSDINANFTSFDEINEVSGKYYIAEAALAMRDAVRDYGLPK